MKDFFRFLISKIFWLNIAIALVIFVLLVWITFVSIDSYTQHDEAISVPDLRGLTVGELEEVISEKSLRYEITDSVYLTDKKRGTVVDQSPSPDFKVKENRKIFITMNAVLPERVLMPELVGVSLRQATAYLETFGLKVGKLSYVPDIGKNVVLKQVYKGKPISTGDYIEKGQSIDLVLGLGESNEKTTIPNLHGLSLNQVFEKLTEYSLNIGAIVCDESVKTSADSVLAKVYKQFPNPSSDSEISLGASMDIWLTKKMELVPKNNETDNQIIIE